MCSHVESDVPDIRQDVVCDPCWDFCDCHSSPDKSSHLSRGFHKKLSEDIVEGPANESKRKAVTVAVLWG